jgi:hypothetical protein
MIWYIIYYLVFGIITACVYFKLEKNSIDYLRVAQILWLPVIVLCWPYYVIRLLIKILSGLKK